MNILLIDDDPSLRKTFRVLLETMGHQVAEACDATEALCLLENGAFDVTFLDRQLRRENGLEILPALLKVVPDQAVVLITASSAAGLVSDAVRRGAYACLAKPFTPDELRLTLDRVSRIRRLRRRIKERGEQPCPLPTAIRQLA